MRGQGEAQCERWEGKVAWWRSSGKLEKRGGREGGVNTQRCRHRPEDKRPLTVVSWPSDSVLSSVKLKTSFCHYKVFCKI